MLYYMYITKHGLDSSLTKQLVFCDSVSYALMNLAFYGVAVDLVVFMRRVLHQENAKAANFISMWTGTVYIFSLFGAFLSDSYMGRYLTCVMFQIIFLIVRTHLHRLTLGEHYNNNSLCPVACT